MIEIFDNACLGCGSPLSTISFHNVEVGPVEGDGLACTDCGTIHAYDRRLRLIAPDAEAWRRWERTAPHVYKTLRYLSDQARTEQQLRDVLERWTPGAGLIGKRE